MNRKRRKQKKAQKTWRSTAWNSKRIRRASGRGGAVAEPGGAVRSPYGEDPYLSAGLGYYTPGRRRKIEPLPSLPERPSVEEENRPVLRLEGERTRGGASARHVQGGMASWRRTTVPIRGSIRLPESHAPREVLGDAAALLQYAKHNRSDDVRHLLESGADPNLTDDPGNEHREAIWFMCRNEDIGEENPEGMKFGRTACHVAAVRGYTEVLRALIAGGANVNLRDHAGKSPLMRAARAGFEDATQLLLQAGAEVDARDLRRSTALIRAAHAGHAGVVRVLLRAGAAVEARDCVGRSALIAACAGPHVEVVRELVEAGADPRPRDGTGADALTVAVEAVEAADPNAPSPFHVVREERIYPVVAMLLERGARDEPDTLGIRPSQRAEERGHFNVAALLRQAS